MSPDKKSTPSTNNNISINGDVKDSAVIIGDNNTVNQTFIQKFFNIFKSDSETLEHRNRRILLGHVENAWIKGVLDASLHGAALLDLGIKPDPEAVTQYPWAIKKESTDETLLAGTSMLEVFDSIGMGRSLLILGAPGSGKTIILLKLARQLIARAREDVTYPIPMVFNLASWTEKLSLADWLAQELNNLYSVPRKTAPDWVKGDKLLLLLDGLDEVRQESRTKCVEAINTFRKEHGLTSLAVCSRSHDYADLKVKLSFEGAIEVQSLTQEQITEFLDQFGEKAEGIKHILEKDNDLREMVETPLFLNIVLTTYQNNGDVNVRLFIDKNAQRSHLFDTYIERMLKRPRPKNTPFKKQDILKWLSWLASRMIEHNTFQYSLENMQPDWLGKKKKFFRVMVGLLAGLISGMTFGMGVLLIREMSTALLVGFSMGIFFGLGFGFMEINMIDALTWNWVRVRKAGIIEVVIGLLGAVVGGLMYKPNQAIGALFGALGAGVGGLALFGLRSKQVNQTTRPGEKISLWMKNFSLIALLIVLGIGLTMLVGGKIAIVITGEKIILNGSSIVLIGKFIGFLVIGAIFIGLQYGGLSLIQHYTLRFLLARNNLLPWRLVPFLDHCVDLIFLRRVGGGYIFVHRLLMEHFAEMYLEDNA